MFASLTEGPARRALAVLAALAWTPLAGAQDLSPAPAPAPAPFPFEFRVYANGLARHEDKPILDEAGRDISDYSRIRALDFDLRADVSENVRVVLVPRIASNPANTEYSIDLEEAYVRYDAAPILGIEPWDIEVRAGEMRAAFGWMNPIRLFDLPQHDRPRALTQFFGEDGYVQTSYRLRVGLPLDSEVHSVDATIEALDSGNPPLTVDEGGNVGAKLARLEWSRWRENEWSWTLGATHMSSQQADRDPLSTRLTSADLLLARPSPGRSFFLGGELVQASISRAAAPDDEPEGYYVWSQLQVGQDWIVGSRYDVSQELASPGTETETIAAYLTWTPSDDLRYTLLAQRSTSDVALLDDATRVFLEVNLALGNDPIRPFWLSR